MGEADRTTELDYTERVSWILLFKYLDDLEPGRAMEAELVGKPSAFIIDADHRVARYVSRITADAQPKLV